MTEQSSSPPQEPTGAPRSVQEASGGELAGRDDDRSAQTGTGGSGWTQLEARASDQRS